MYSGQRFAILRLKKNNLWLLCMNRYQEKMLYYVFRNTHKFNNKMFTERAPRPIQSLICEVRTFVCVFVPSQSFSFQVSHRSQGHSTRSQASFVNKFRTQILPRPPLPPSSSKWPPKMTSPNDAQKLPPKLLPQMTPKNYSPKLLNKNTPQKWPTKLRPKKTPKKDFPKWPQNLPLKWAPKITPPPKKKMNK